MKKDLQIEARKLRKESTFTIRKIAGKLNVSKSSVSNWVRDIELIECFLVLIFIHQTHIQ